MRKHKHACECRSCVLTRHLERETEHIRRRVEENNAKIRGLRTFLAWSDSYPPDGEPGGIGEGAL